MRYKTQRLSNFSLAIHTTSQIVRPDNEWQLHEVFLSHKEQTLLARGHGLSYSDCCLNDNGIIVDTSRLNHMISFDSDTGLAVCQGAVTFADLFLLHPQFIPPVIPGTLYATLAGGIAHDVHGKNNHNNASLGHYIEWMELQIGTQSIRCSPFEHRDLFIATIAGLGLTGIIKRLAIRLQKASRIVSKHSETFTCFSSLIARMQGVGIQHDYQVAWLDLLNTPRAVLSFADHRDAIPNTLERNPLETKYTIPKWPIRLVSRWFIKQCNRAYFHQATPNSKTLPLWQFNNPLDAIPNWNRLYGKKGLLQFQAVFDATIAKKTIDQVLTLIHTHRAVPTLAVLKYFTQKGKGLLSFVQPGFTLAIDFIHNQEARNVIMALNQLITELGGKIYLAKDVLLSPQQFSSMYDSHQAYCDTRAAYHCPMVSDLGKRIGIHS